MSQGTVSAYIRLDAGLEPLAIAALERAGFWAFPDDGDPDRPPGSVDLRVYRHYGMTNPDERIVEQHHSDITAVLLEGGITVSDCGGSVVVSSHLKPGRVLQVWDARAGALTGFSIRAEHQAEVETHLKVMAEALGMLRKELDVEPPTTGTGKPALPPDAPSVPVADPALSTNPC